MKNSIFAFFDGDNIGDKIELLLIEGRLSEASLLSDNLNLALEEIKRILNDKKVKIHICGGDDLLIEMPSNEFKYPIIEEVRDMFFQRTNCTFSCGIGINLNETIANLHRAKISGKNKIVSSEGAEI